MACCQQENVQQQLNVTVCCKADIKWQEKICKALGIKDAKATLVPCNPNDSAQIWVKLEADIGVVKGFLLLNTNLTMALSHGTNAGEVVLVDYNGVPDDSLLWVECGNNKEGFMGIGVANNTNLRLDVAQNEEGITLVLQTSDEEKDSQFWQISSYP
ncbi:ricin B-like lectin R40C1 isoform X2 [Cryptomeria japonica]|uniref:ricin B-like lectin R40C1 isoform X2 n=1 Tax=Cryptomeria japonica TaxID=3369 RepID=UPI0027DA1DBB|nr:ricin B-like lectin R40C1 isoform X2 [Cryptomeria japonica]